MKINVNGILAQAIIGCYDNERIAKQDVIIDLAIKLYPNNWITPDSLDTTVDYDTLVDFIKDTVQSTNYHLLESLSEYLIDKLLKQFSLIHKIDITISKPAICGVKAKYISISNSCTRKFKVALALGSNDMLAQQQIITAIEILGEYVSDIQIGGFYKTTPVGFTDQNDFVNTALIGFVNLKPEELLGKIKTIEKLMGKHETFVNGPRCIDIDLILFDDLVYEHNFLRVPHKAMHMRDFVLRPLADIDDKWVHPTLNKSVGELLKDIQETSVLEQINYYK